MRRGAKKSEWTYAEVRYLLDSAGGVPKREMCRHLRRSGKAVERMASRLREQGHAISLRCYQPTTIICPACGRSSATAKETGICRPCTLRRRLAATEGQIAELMHRLPPNVRAIYEDTEAEKGSRAFDPMPRAPYYAEPPTRYRRLRDEEAYDRAMEEWEARRVQRELKAAQKRKERIQRKLRELCRVSEYKK